MSAPTPEAPSKKDAEEAIASSQGAVLQIQKARSTSPEQLQAVCLAIVVDRRNRRRLKFPVSAAAHPSSVGPRRGFGS